MTFREIQDMAIKRFNSGLRGDLKEWIRATYGLVWEMEEWTFKTAVAAVTVTANSDTLTNVPADLGVPHLLQNSQGDKLKQLGLRDYMLNYQGSAMDAAGLPYFWTLIGDGPGATIKVGPPSSETSALYELTYERACCSYPSTTLSVGATLPVATLTVVSTAEFPSAGTVMIAGRKVTYTGKTSTTLTGCSGGSGTFAIGEPVVSLTATAYQLAADTDVPLLPPDTHMILVHGAQAIGQSLENDSTVALSDERVTQMLEGMRRRYLTAGRGETAQFGAGDDCRDW